MKFVDNNFIFSTIKMTSFYVNKKFHSRMSFTLNDIQYVIAQKRLLTDKVENIVEIMRNVLNLMKINIKKVQICIKKQIDKHRTDINYAVKNKIYLFIKHIVIDKLLHKLKNKMINLYSIIQKMSVAY